MSSTSGQMNPGMGIDNTKKLQLQLSNITTGNTRVITIPDANTSLVGVNTVQVLTNKTLTAPVISTITNTGTLTLPTSTDTLIGKSTTDTLTNKTLDSTTNTITSNKLRTSTTTVSISGATAPTVNQILTATSGTTATWQSTSGGSITYNIVSSSTTTSTTSSTHVAITSMTYTPPSGTYLITFSSFGNISSGDNAYYAIYVGGSIVDGSERILAAGGGHMTGANQTVYTQSIQAVNGSQVVDVRFKTVGGTFTVEKRNLIFIKLS